MSDVRARPRRAMFGAPRVDREAFLAACAAKGCTTDEQRAELLEMPRRSVYRYANGEINPGLTTARWIANRLAVTVDDLWPAA